MVSSQGIKSALFSRTLLAVSALIDGVLRLPEDIIVPLVSVTGGLFGNPRIGFVTTWFLFYMILYNFAHLPYSYLDTGETEIPRNAFGFRIVFATSGVGLGIAIQQFAGQSSLLMLALLGGLPVGGVFLAYLSVYHNWNLFNPQGKAMVILKSLNPVGEENESGLEYEGWLGYYGTATYFFGLAGVFGLPVILAAFVVHILILAYPVLDILILIWAVSGHFFSRVLIGPSKKRVQNLGFDLERFLINVVEQATRSVYGMFVTAFALGGVLWSVLYLAIAVRVTAYAIETIVTVARLDPSMVTGIWLNPSYVLTGILLPVWNIFGAVVLLFFSGSYSLWVWIRELQRLPHFLDISEERTTVSELEPVTRVYGFVAVPIVAYITTIPMATADTQSVVVGYALVWPTILAGGLWTIRKTRQQSWQPVATEHRWVCTGSIFQMFVSLIAGRTSDLTDVIAGTRSLVSLFVYEFGVTVILILIAMFSTIIRNQERLHGIQRYSVEGLLIIIGAIVAVGSVVIPSGNTFSFVLAAICLGFGLFLWIAEYYLR